MADLTVASYGSRGEQGNELSLRSAPALEAYVRLQLPSPSFLRQKEDTKDLFGRTMQRRRISGVARRE